MAKGTTFKQIFKKREYQVLLGNGKKDLFFLSSILFLTFLAIGHVLGGRMELDERMNNPFTNWINIPVSRSTGDQSDVSKLMDHFESQNHKDSFNLTSVKGYVINWVDALEFEYFTESKTNLKDYRVQNLRARSMNFDDPIADLLLSNKNLVKRYKDQSESCDVIITKTAISALGFDFNVLDTLYLPILDKDWKEKRVIYKFPISAVVNTLPDNVDLIISENFYNLIESHGSNYIELGKRDKIEFHSTEKFSEERIEKLLNDSIVVDDVFVTTQIINGIEFVKHQLVLRESINFLPDLIELQKDWELLSCFNIQDFYCKPISDTITKPYYYAFHFKDVSKVKAFSEFVKKEFNINVSLSQVESRDNFHLISRLANLFIYLLVIFSSISIILYLQNTIKNHIEKIKPNLGTLKAFGLSDEVIRRLYIEILIKFFLSASLISLVLIVAYKLILDLLNFDLYFKPFNFYVLLIWIGLLIILIIFFYRYLRGMLFKPPGDLIYNR